MHFLNLNSPSDFGFKKLSKLYYEWGNIEKSILVVCNELLWT